MFTTLKDFQKLWDEEAGMTAKTFAALTDASLARAIDDEHRTIGRIAWHIAQTIPEMLGRLGLPVKGPGEHDAVPTSAEAIATAYDTAARSLGPAKEDWSTMGMEAPAI